MAHDRIDDGCCFFGFFEEFIPLECFFLSALRLEKYIFRTFEYFREIDRTNSLADIFFYIFLIDSFYSNSK